MQPIFRFVLILIFVFTFQYVKAVDELVQLRYKISHLSSPQAKLDTALAIVGNYQDTKTEMYLLEVIETYSHELRYRDKVSKAIRDMARNVFNTTSNVDSLKLFFNKLDKLRYIDSKLYRKYHTELRSFICYAYIYQNKSSAVLSIANSIFNDAKKLNDGYSQAIAYELIATINLSNMRYEMAADYMIKAYYASMQDKDDYAYSMQLVYSILDIYICSKHYDKLIEYINEAKPLFQRLITENSQNIYLQRYGSILECAYVLYYLSQNNLSESEKHFNRLKDFPSNIDYYCEMLCRIAKARFYLAKGQYNEAYEYVKDDNFLKTAHIVYSETRIDVFKKLGMKDECIAAQDTLMEQYKLNFNLQSSSELDDLCTKYEMENLEKSVNLNQIKSSRWMTLSIVLISCFVIVLITLLAYRISKFRKERLRYIHTSKLQTSFLQNINHEIRTPLNAISGFTQVFCDPEMRNQLTEEEINEFGNIMKSNTRHLTTLINDIMSASKLVTEEIKLNLSLYSVNTICRNALDAVHYSVAENVRLYITTDAEDDFQINTDHVRVEQILCTFLRNSVKYTSEGKVHLHCSVTENPGRVTFTVTDTGPVIPLGDSDVFGMQITQRLSSLLNGKVIHDTSYFDGMRFILIL